MPEYPQIPDLIRNRCFKRIEAPSKDGIFVFKQNKMPTHSPIEDIRKTYKKGTLSEGDVAANPIDQFRRWWDQAVKSNIDEVNAMTIATCTPEGKPSARMVLLKHVHDNGFVFFTNYSSRKGHEITGNPNVALVFFWKELERQIRIEGTVEKVSDAESDEYFQSRPRESRIGAWVSHQSTVIPSRESLQHSQQEIEKEYEGKEIPRPPFWGGFLVKPFRMEFWQGRPGRLHDRIVYTRAGKDWKISRLAP